MCFAACNRRSAAGWHSSTAGRHRDPRAQASQDGVPGRDDTENINPCNDRGHGKQRRPAHTYAAASTSSATGMPAPTTPEASGSSERGASSAWSPEGGVDLDAGRQDMVLGTHALRLQPSSRRKVAGRPAPISPHRATRLSSTRCVP